jgi:hypothetical protein
MLKKLIVLLLMTTVWLAADSPKRIEQKVADQNLTNKVEPTVPPLAKTMECIDDNCLISSRSGHDPNMYSKFTLNLSVLHLAHGQKRSGPA